MERVERMPEDFQSDLSVQQNPEDFTRKYSGGKAGPFPVWIEDGRRRVLNCSWNFEPDLSTSTGTLSNQQHLSYGSQSDTSKAFSLGVGGGLSKEERNFQNPLTCHRQSQSIIRDCRSVSHTCASGMPS
jgi:hypothetical protein